MVECIEALSGSIIQFGGDAVFALFQGGFHARRAIKAASELMRLLQEHGRIRSSIGTLELKMKVTAASGPISAYHVQAGAQTIYLLGGPAATRLSQLGQVVRCNEVLVDEALARALGPPIELEARGGLLRTEWPERLPLRLSGGRLRSPPDEALLRYLPPELRTFLRRESVEGEYRTVACAFLRFECEPRPRDRVEALELLTGFCGTVSSILGQYGGLILKCDTNPLCDSMLVAFGLPEAHEDDAMRAVQAALELLDRVRVELPRLRVSIALNFGVVVAADVGGLSRRTFDMMGDAVNLTARLLEETPPGEVRITQPVARRCESAIRLEPLGARIFRGKDQPVELYRAVERRSPSSAPTRRLPPFVGREAELAVIQEVLEALRGGQGGILAVQAEAGAGKSRLWLEMRSLLRQRDLPFHFGSCQSYGGRHGYSVFADLFRRMLDLEDGGDAEAVFERLELILGHGLAEGEAAHIADMMGIRSQAELGRGAELKATNLRVACKLLRSLAATGPVVIALEDLHWADPSSLELISLLAGEVIERPLLLVLIYRPGFRHTLSGRPGYRELTLRPLPSEAGLRLLEALFDGPVPPALARRLVEQSAGIPFFLEELARAVVEHRWLRREGGGWELEPSMDVRELPLPDSIEAVLSVRIHHLPPAAKRVVQCAAAIGRSVPYRLLEEACEEDITGAVGFLREREILFELPARGAGADARDRELIFKHALTREVAYQSMLERKRQCLHLKIALAIETLHQGQLEPRSEQLAWHYAASSAPSEAVSWLSLSARKALSQGRFAEGRRAAEQALEILARAPGGGTAEDRFQLLLCWGDAAAWEGNYRQVLETYVQAEQVAPDDGARAELLGRRAYIFWAMGDFPRAVETAGCGLSLARRARSRGAQARCLREQGRAALELDRLPEATLRFRQALELSRQLGDFVGAAMALRGWGIVLCLRGCFSEADLRLRAARALSRAQSDRRGEAEALLWLGRSACRQGELAEAEALLSEAETIATAVGDHNTRVAVLAAQLELDMAGDEVSRALDRLAEGGRLRLEGCVEAVRRELLSQETKLEAMAKRLPKGLEPASARSVS